MIYYFLYSMSMENTTGVNVVIVTVVKRIVSHYPINKKYIRYLILP